MAHPQSAADAEQNDPGIPQEVTPSPRTAMSRRNLVLGTGIGALAGIAGYAAGTLNRHHITASPPASSEQHAPQDPGSAAANDSNPAGHTQAGVARPATPQRSALFVVADLDLTELPQTLAQLGATVLQLVAAPDPAYLPDGAGDLTVLVGLGARALAALPAGSTLTNMLDLPTFAGDEALDPRFLGGDLLLCLAASDPGALEPALAALTPTLPGFSIRWSNSGFRGPGEDGIARNPLGFHDGIIVPRGDEQLDKNVWLTEGPLHGGSVCVIRRFVLDTHRFHQLDLPAQSAVFGRDKVSGVPLSGGSLRDEGNVVAKTEAGEFLVPANSHLRAAHPSFTGSGLMLRRSYSFASAPLDGTAPGSVEQGLLFMSFQNDVRTFARTQQRMDDMDALMGFARPTATAAFAILPGFDHQRPLGSTLA